MKRHHNYSQFLKHILGDDVHHFSRTLDEIGEFCDPLIVNKALKRITYFDRPKWIFFLPDGTPRSLAGRFVKAIAYEYGEYSIKRLLRRLRHDKTKLSNHSRNAR